jgi:hypothetical protein
MRYDIMEQLEREIREARRSRLFWRARAAERDPHMDAGTVANHIDHLEIQIRRLEGLPEIFDA